MKNKDYIDLIKFYALTSDNMPDWANYLIVSKMGNIYPFMVKPRMNDNRITWDFCHDGMCRSHQGLSRNIPKSLGNVPHHIDWDCIVIEL